MSVTVLASHLDLLTVTPVFEKRDPCSTEQEDLAALIVFLLYLDQLEPQEPKRHADEGPGSTRWRSTSDWHHDFYQTKVITAQVLDQCTVPMLQTVAAWESHLVQLSQQIIGSNSRSRVCVVHKGYAQAVWQEKHQADLEDSFNESQATSIVESKLRFEDGDDSDLVRDEVGLNLEAESEEDGETVANAFCHIYMLTY